MVTLTEEFYFFLGRFHLRIVVCTKQLILIPAWFIVFLGLAGSTKQVKLTVYVDKESARAMNSGEEKIEDILVLHLEGGKDFFVSLLQ